MPLSADNIKRPWLLRLTLKAACLLSGATLRSWIVLMLIHQGGSYSNNPRKWTAWLFQDCWCLEVKAKREARTRTHPQHRWVCLCAPAAAARSGPSEWGCSGSRPQRDTDTPAPWTHTRNIWGKPAKKRSRMETVSEWKRPRETDLNCRSQSGLEQT